MGQLTGVVMLGFVSLHIAEILCIIAFATTEWTTGTLNTTSHHGNHSHSEEDQINKGLWEFCGPNENCTKLDSGNQTRWFKAVQGTQTAGVGLGILALIITYAMLLAASCKNSAKGAFLSTLVQLLSGSCILAALVVFGLKALKNDTSSDIQPGYDLDYGWSYYVDIAGGVFMWISMLMTFATARFFARRRSGYEDI